MKKDFCTAICLAGGSGSRMQSNVAKQFIPINGKPLIYYALKAFQESDIIDEIILVSRPEDVEYIAEEVVEKYGFEKVTNIVFGGAERYNSVWNGIKAVKNACEEGHYIFIHDGARPMITQKIISDTYEAAREFGSGVAAVPSKDTIKVVDADGFASFTPDRKTLWNIQTPQVFAGKIIYEAYSKMIRGLNELKADITITDDANVVEVFSVERVKIVMASYDNIKVTTPEDISIAESILQEEG